MAATYDFQMDQGASWVYNLGIRDQDDNPVDLTGASVVMQARTTLRSPIPLFSVSTDTGEITLDPSEGLVSIAIPPAITAEVRQSGLYSIVITYSSGEVERLLEGKLILQPEIVR